MVVRLLPLLTSHSTSIIIYLVFVCGLRRDVFHSRIMSHEDINSGHLLQRWTNT